MDFLILALATWRLSSLLANEDGPYQVFERLRERLGVYYSSQPFGEPVRMAKNEIAAGITCTWCNSVWVGAFLTASWLTIGRGTTLVYLPLALSAAAILVDEFIGGPENGDSEHSYSVSVGQIREDTGSQSSTL